MATLNDENFGRTLTWNYKNRTEYYEGSCGEIRGSGGEFYPTDRTKGSIEIFSAELCKNALLKYEGEVEVNGVKGYKYSARDLFDNGKCKYFLEFCSKWLTQMQIHRFFVISGNLITDNNY